METEQSLHGNAGKRLFYLTLKTEEEEGVLQTEECD